MKDRDDINHSLYWAAGYQGSAPAEGEISTLAEIERLYIERALALCGGNIAKAAKCLQISPSTLYRKKAQWE